MISDLSRVSYKAYLYMMKLFRGEPEEPVVPPELEEAISKIASTQNASRERLDKISTEAANLLKTLTEKEAQQVRRWNQEIEKFLKDEGVDAVCIDEFLRDPSREKLEELRIKYPNMRK